ncbi:dynamin family protein [Breznakiellaceae bacterium SP9]
MQEQVIKKLKAIEAISAQYEDVIKDEANDLRNEGAIVSADALQEHFAAMANEDRLLTIGIIGRVKAGKSSLLNSIFFKGDSVLPKAATPMTASLTVLTYGEAFSAKVFYYSAKDIEDIKQKHDEFQAKWNTRFEEKKKELAEQRSKQLKKADSDIDERAKRAVDLELKGDEKNNSLSASFDQYERMKKTGKLGSIKETEQKVEASGLEELLGKLNQYVGADGVLMPFTKSAEIQLPLDEIRDIQVVDTPGINDPVASRGERTNEYLKSCDVVFIVSSAGQFVSSEDTGLMDRLSSKEGVQELYFIASQVDNQLYGNEHEKSGGDLHKALKNIRDQLSSHARKTLEGIKSSDSLVEQQFGKLIAEADKRVMITSSICHAMSLRFNEQGSWDADMKHVWGLLNDQYSDYFGSGETAKASLDALANINTVQEKISLARNEKDRIKAEKQAKELTQKAAAIDDFLDKLKKAVGAKIEKVQDTDMKQVEAEKKKIEAMCAKGTEAIDGTFEDCVDDFKSDLRETIKQNSKGLFKEASSGVKESEQSVTRHKYWTTGHLWWKKQHSEAYEVTTVRPGAVKSLLSNLVNELQDDMIRAVEAKKKEWKESVQKRITSELRAAIANDDNIPFDMLKTTLRRMVNAMELPDLDLASHAFTSTASGTLEGSEAERFIEEVNTYQMNLKTVYNQKTNEFIRAIEESAKREKASDSIFNNLRTQIETLEKEIGNKKLTLDRLEKCLTALRCN